MAVRVSLTEHVTIEARGAASTSSAFRTPGQARLRVSARFAGRPVSRDELAEALWGDKPPATWEKALSSSSASSAHVLNDCGLEARPHQRFRLLPARPPPGPGSTSSSPTSPRPPPSARSRRASSSRPAPASAAAHRPAHLPAGRARSLGRGRARGAPGDAGSRARLPGGGSPDVGRFGRRDPRRRGAGRPRAVPRDRLPAADGGAHRRRQPRGGAPGVRAVPTAARGRLGPTVTRDRSIYPRAPQRIFPGTSPERTPEGESSRRSSRSGRKGRASEKCGGSASSSSARRAPPSASQRQGPCSCAEVEDAATEIFSPIRSGSSAPRAAGLMGQKSLLDLHQRALTGGRGLDLGHEHRRAQCLTGSLHPSGW